MPEKRMKKKSVKGGWTDYELLDCGDLKKLERFGPVTLIRPEPGAVWRPAWSMDRWRDMADAECEQVSNNKATWKTLGKKVRDWSLDYHLGPGKPLRFNLQLTGFKHVGIFPEQHLNWETVYDFLRSSGGEKRVLNLFAYTGGASLAAKKAGADVVHVDSIKQVVTWARNNMSASGLSDIRWVVEDALKFVARESKRGNTYDVVILDPPAFGLGAKGERWKLESSINELMSAVSGVVNKDKYLVVLNTYSPGFTPLVVENILIDHFGKGANVRAKELFLRSKTGYRMPAGVTGLASKQ